MNAYSPLFYIYVQGEEKGPFPIEYLCKYYPTRRQWDPDAYICMENMTEWLPFDLVMDALTNKKKRYYYLYQIRARSGPFTQKQIVKRLSKATFIGDKTFIQPLGVEELIPLNIVFPIWRERFRSSVLGKYAAVLLLGALGGAVGLYFYPQSPVPVKRFVDGYIASLSEASIYKEDTPLSLYYLNKGTPAVQSIESQRALVLKAAEEHRLMISYPDEIYLALREYADALKPGMVIKAVAPGKRLPKDIQVVLQRAIEVGDLSMLKYAASQGIDLSDTRSDLFGRDHGIAWEYAVRCRKWDLIESFIDSVARNQQNPGQDADFSPVSGMLLRVATVENDLKMVKYLLKKGIKIDHSIEEYSPIQAFSQGPEMRALLRSAGAKNEAWVLIKENKDQVTQEVLGQILTAIEQDDLGALETLKAKGVKFDQPLNQYSKMTFYGVATNENNPRMMKFFAENGLNPQSGTRPFLSNVLEGKNYQAARALIDHVPAMNKDEALYVVAKDGHDTTLATYLLDQGANPNGQVVMGWGNKKSPLLNAVRSVKMAQLLVDRGADVNAKSENGDSALESALDDGCIEMAEFLLSKGALFPQDKLEDYFSRALYGPRFSNLNFYLKRGMKLNSDSPYSPLLVAIKRGGASATKLVLVEWLIKQGADVNARDSMNKTPFMQACLNNDIALMDMLLTLGAEAKAEDSESHKVLFDIKNPEVFSKLMDLGYKVPPPNDQGQNLIMYYLSRGIYDKKLIKECVKAGISLNELDQDGNSVLHLATRQNSFEAIDAITAVGADMEAKNKNGDTALLDHLKGTPDFWIVKDLVHFHGADVNSRTSDGLGVLDLCMMIPDKGRYGSNVELKKRLSDFLASKGAPPSKIQPPLLSTELKPIDQHSIKLPKPVETESMTLVINSMHGKDVGYIAELEVKDEKGKSYPRGGWKVSASSVETEAEPGDPQRMIDGNPDTFWHSNYTKGEKTPYTLKINFGKKLRISEVFLLNRQNSEAKLKDITISIP